VPSQPIVVATDLQARSDRAIDRALMLAAVQDRPVAIVHVLEKECENEEQRARAEMLVRRVLPDPEAEVQLLLPCGSAPKTIARIASELDAALLVAGVASFNELRDYFLGTAVDYIIRHATMPVLVIKDRPHGPYRRLLVAVDFSEASKQAVLAAASLFPDAHLDVVNAYHVPFEGWQSGKETREEMTRYAQGELKAFLADPELAAIPADRITARLGYGGTQEVIHEALARDNPDLLVLGTTGSSGFRHATLGSQANALLSSAAVDTLMVPKPS
jgi:nucleotide-binding universal stress UspA family protein